MELLKFIKWQWNRFDSIERVWIFTVLSSISTAILLSCYTNMAGWIIALLSLTSLIVYFFAFVLVVGVFEQWEVYKREKEKEADDIVAKLRQKSRQL